LNIFETIIEIIKSKPQEFNTKFIAIDGLGGSGKTTFTKNLIDIEPTIKILELDHFPCLPEEYPFHPAGAQTRVSISRFMKEALIPLSLGKPAIYMNSFWWPTDLEPTQYIIEPGGIIMVEGCYSFHYDLRKYYDFSIWIDCPEEEAIKRAINRDGKQGVEIWEKVHSPNERNYAKKQQPIKDCDLIISNNKSEFSIQKHYPNLFDKGDL